MARRSSNAKQSKPEPRSLLRVVDRIKTWQVLVAAAVALLGAGWWARARASEFSTKDEVGQAIAPLIDHAAKDDRERAILLRAMQDFKDNQDQLMKWVWELHQKK